MIRICLLLLSVFSFWRLPAQDSGRRQTIDSAASEYLQIVGRQSALYYGRDQSWQQHTTNHPYLEDSQYAKARLSYYGVVYPEALLRLDLHRDELLLLSPERRNIVMSTENIDFVELHGKHIIYLRTDSLPASPPPGFYILLHSGNCRVLEKRIATLKERTDARVYERYYEFSARFYLYKDGAYYHIRNKRGLLKVLQPYKRELKRFISGNHLRFRQNAEEFMRRTVAEYEKISGLL